MASPKKPILRKRRPDAKSKPGMKPTPTRPKTRPNLPDAISQTHTYLIARKRGRQRYVPLTFHSQISAGGRTMTGFQLGPRGGLIPNPRARRLERKGYHDSLQPGLRISDLIGRAQADLSPDTPTGLKILRLHLRNPLVQRWLAMGVGLTNFLTPRPSQPKARQFTDSRPPPGGVLPGVTTLVRRFTRKKSHEKAPGQSIRYLIDAPRHLMRQAKATVGVSGEVTIRPGAAWPTAARLILNGVPRKGGGHNQITVTFEGLGQRCNR